MMRPEGVLSKKDILQRIKLATILLWSRVAPRITQMLWSMTAGGGQGRSATGTGTDDSGLDMSPVLDAAKCSCYK